ncbi:hypothetical protein AEAC466_13500 [Asticcacaulis sp. AC466]|uniref:hypothetical protein n=1 Tax=Asticcacaulis sp. AC466 TaxID=1282362 RepID=UPI0003C3BD1C|nr:hypothetical protein [Asticcacaulis sp. AC466]ESQ83262.1 hypothetical protein AEAC466_13500 [Asticcacaulis sp. AC466]
MKQYAIYADEQPFTLFIGSEDTLAANLSAWAQYGQAIAWRELDDFIPVCAQMPDYDTSQVTKV